MVLGRENIESHTNNVPNDSEVFKLDDVPFHVKYGIKPDLPTINLDEGFRRSSVERRDYRNQEVDVAILEGSKYVKTFVPEHGEPKRIYEYEGKIYELTPDQFAYLDSLRNTERPH